jgi:hypothetical protein
MSKEVPMHIVPIAKVVHLDLFEAKTTEINQLHDTPTVEDTSSYYIILFFRNFGVSLSKESPCEALLRDQFRPSKLGIMKLAPLPVALILYSTAGFVPHFLASDRI